MSYHGYSNAEPTLPQAACPCCALPLEIRSYENHQYRQTYVRMRHRGADSMQDAQMEFELDGYAMHQSQDQYLKALFEHKARQLSMHVHQTYKPFPQGTITGSSGYAFVGPAGSLNTYRPLSTDVHPALRPKKPKPVAKKVLPLLTAPKRKLILD